MWHPGGDPEKVLAAMEKDQIATRKKRGSKGAQLPASVTTTYRRRNVVERSLTCVKQLQGLATRYDKLAITYQAAVAISAILTRLRNSRRHDLETAHD